MLKTTIITLTGCLALAACASDSPRIVQVSPDAPEVSLRPGMVTQIEMPESERVRSVVVGDPSLVSAEQADNVVNLLPKTGVGETNMIVRATEESGHTAVYQYHIVVQDR